MTDIIDLIDQAITPTCHQCGAELGDSLSNDFCGPDCQHAWHAARVDPLVGYEEPSDLPQHVHNLVELTSPETTPNDAPQDDSFLMPRYFREQMGRYLTELATHTAPALARPRVELANDGLLRDMADYQRYTWTGPRLTHPLDTGAPWIRSPITPASMPPTGVLIGGRRHGETIGTANPPHRTVDTIEPVDPDQTLFNSDTIRFKRVTYRLVGHNGVHWCYVAPGTTRTLDGDEPLTVEYHHNDFPRDTWWVTITGRTRGVLCELTNELLASDAAVRAWFTDRAPYGGWPITDGSWEITETRPPFRREQT